MEKYILADKIDTRQVLTSPAKVLDLDLNQCTVEDLEFVSNYSLEINPPWSGTLPHYNITALALWFEVDFPKPIETMTPLPDEDLSNDEDYVVGPVTLSTSPEYDFTHWKHQIMQF